MKFSQKIFFQTTNNCTSHDDDKKIKQIRFWTKFLLESINNRYYKIIVSLYLEEDLVEYNSWVTVRHPPNLPTERLYIFFSKSLKDVPTKMG